MFFFTPVLALMKRARYAHKFLLIFTLFMLPYCWLSISKLVDLNAMLKQSQHELQGLQAIERYLPSYRQALELAGLHLVGYARNKDDAKEAIARNDAAFVQQAETLNAWLQDSPFAAQQSIAVDPGNAVDGKLAVQGLGSQMIEHGRHLHGLIATFRT